LFRATSEYSKIRSELLVDIRSELLVDIRSELLVDIRSELLAYNEMSKIGPVG